MRGDRGIAVKERRHADAHGSARAAGTELMDVRCVSGEAYEVSVRGHQVIVDQPTDAGGQDTAPTPTELFVASLATCVA
jgi:hypothetical protein